MNLNKLMVQAGATVIVWGTASGAMAFADDDARRAILDLRAQVAALEEQLKNAQISFVTRLDNLQNQNRILTGQVEELANAVRQEKRSTRDLYTSIDERLGKFEPREVEVNGVKVMVQPQEQASYDAAVELLKTGDYKKAAAAFNAFVADWPQSAYAGDAVYWRGSSLFALEQYKSTINVQNSLIREASSRSRCHDFSCVGSGRARQCQSGFGDAGQGDQAISKCGRSQNGCTIAKNAQINQRRHSNTACSLIGAGYCFVGRRKENVAESRLI